MPTPIGFADEATCWIRTGCPLPPATRASHEAVVPPAEPAHVHAHGPLPPTVDAVPALQRLLVGALLRSAPFEEPHAPLTADDEGAEHNPVAPPLLPVQDQVHGPLPL